MFAKRALIASLVLPSAVQSLGADAFMNSAGLHTLDWCAHN